MTPQNTPHRGRKQKFSILSILIILALYIALSYLQKDTPDGQQVPQPVPQATQTTQNEQIEIVHEFRSKERLTEHFEKHGSEFDYSSEQEYLEGANRVIASPHALQKLEAEDGDYVYFLEETGEFVILSKDGYIRTYFKPEDGIDYFNRQ